MPDSPHKPQWHPAFYAAAGLELQANHQEIQMIPEYNLSKEPIRIDLLIIKNTGQTKKIENEIRADRFSFPGSISKRTVCYAGGRRTSY